MASKGFQETGMGDEASLLKIFLSRTYWKLEQLRRKGFGSICLGESFVGFIIHSSIRLSTSKFS